MKIDALETCQALRDYGWRLYMCVLQDGKYRECVSYPFPNGYGTFGIMLRTKDDPTSMFEFTFPQSYVDNAVEHQRKFGL